MVVVPPATPPSTLVSPSSSPTSPADTFVQGFEHDLEKGEYDEKRAVSHNNDGGRGKGAATWLPSIDSRSRCLIDSIDEDLQVDTTHSRVSSWVRKASALNPLPRYPWRKEDGREKLIQRSRDAFPIRHIDFNLTDLQSMTIRKGIPNWQPS